MRVVFFILLLFSSFQSDGQILIKSVVKGELTRDTLEHVYFQDHITFQQGFRTVKTKAAKNGKYSLEFEFNLEEPFTIRYHSPDHLGKVIHFDFSNADSSNLSYSIPFRPLEAVNMTMTSLPDDREVEVRVAEFSWSNRTLGVNVDMVFLENQKRIIEDYFKNPELYGTYFSLDSGIIVEGAIYRPEPEIRYGLAKSWIDSTSFGQLDRVVGFLRANPNIALEIGVHADHRQSDFISSRPTEARAKSIRDYCIAKGVSQNQLIPVGYGKTHPLVSEKYIDQLDSKEEKEKAHLKNRRTEFKVIDLSLEILQLDFYFQQENWLKKDSADINVGDEYYCFPGIQFELNSDVIDSMSYDALNEVGEYLIKNRNLIVEVQFHEDTRPKEQFSKRFGSVRVKAIHNYFIEMGVHKEQLTGKAYGGESPLVRQKEIDKLKNHRNIEAAHQMNRRTVFKIISNTRTL